MKRPLFDHHQHTLLTDLARVLKEQGELMLAQVQAVVDSTAALKATSDKVVAYVAANPPVAQADLDALTAATATLGQINTALTALVPAA